MTSVDVRHQSKIYSKKNSRKKIQGYSKFKQTSNYENSFNLSLNLDPQLFNYSHDSKTMSFFGDNNCQVSKNQTQKNHINSNKRKLYNFFQDRIPKEKITIFKNQTYFSPDRIFEMRRIQNQKQMNTSISLKQSFEVKKYPVSVPIKKLEQTFNSTKMKCSKTNGTLLNKNILTLNYKQATQSSLMKRCLTAKKKAYNNVFGDDVHFKSSNTKIVYSKVEASTTQQQNQKRKKNEYNQKRDRAQFSNLLKKLNDYTEEFKPGKKGEKQKEPLKQDNQHLTTEEDTNPQKVVDNQALNDKQQVVNLIKKIAFNYKQKTMKVINMIEADQFYDQQTKNGTNITKQTNNQMNKINIMNPKFYRELKEHKNSRLKIRKLALQNLLPSEIIYNPVQGIKQFDLDDIQLEQRQQLTMLLTITDRNLQSLQTNRHQIVRDTKVNCTVRQKLRNFSKNLVATMHSMYLYGIQNDKMYVALWKKRSPFQIQGSYTFMKYIKAGNLDAIKKFHKENQNYIYTVDNDDRTALIYAAQNQQSQVIKFLIQTGVHIDYKTYSGKTALYFAIKNQDYKSVVYLLEGGSSPWSTKTCNLSVFYDFANTNIRIALKNARRIHIAMKLRTKFSDQFKFWQKMKENISISTQFRFQ